MCAVIIINQIHGSTWCWICGIHSIPHLHPQQVKSRYSHNTLQDYFHHEGIWLIPLTSHWSNLKRPFSCDQTVIVLHQVFGLLSAQQEQGHPVQVRQSRKRRDSTCLWRCVITSLETWLLWLWGLKLTPTRPNLPPHPVEQISYSNIYILFYLFMNGRIWDLLFSIYNSWLNI